ATCLLVAGCTAGGEGPAPSDADDAPQTETDAPSGTLTVTNSFVIDSLDPAQVYEATGNTVVHAVYDTLLTFEGSDVSNPVPLLAESWEANDDATEFTFHLHPDAAFSDGSPVEAEDVVFSLNRLRNLMGSPAVIVDG